MADRRQVRGVIANQRPEGFFSPPTLRLRLTPLPPALHCVSISARSSHERRSPAHRLSALQ
jgi:hypothetical protein